MDANKSGETETGANASENRGEYSSARVRRPGESPITDKNYFRLLVENAYDGILVLNKNGRIRYVSPPVQRLTGYEPEEMLGRRPFDFVHPDDVENLRRVFLEGIKEPGSMEQVEFRSLNKDGSLHIMQGVGTNMLNEPSVAGVVINIRDITGYRRIEQELRDSEERYRYLVENLNAVVFTVNAEGVMTYVSPALERTSGYKAEELIGRPFTEFVHPDDLPGLIRSFQKTISGELEPYEFRVMDKDGKVRYIQTSSRPIVKDDEAVGLLGTMTEITDRVEAEEARRRNEEHFKSAIRRQIRYYRSSE